MVRLCGTENGRRHPGGYREDTYYSGRIQIRRVLKKLRRKGQCENMAQLWGGRFTKETDKLVYRFNASISFDQKLYRQDVAGSQAHVRMLAKQGILTETERSASIKGSISIFNFYPFV